MPTSAPISLIGVALVSSWTRENIGRFASVLATHGEGVGVRSGVIPAHAHPLKVVSAGGRNITINPGAAELATPASQGCLPIFQPTSVSLTSDTADGVNPRWDLVIVEVDDLGTADTFGNFRIVKGIPSPSPQVPTTNWLDPADPVARPLHNGGWFALAALYVPAAQGGGSVTTITDLRPMTVAAGGLVPIPGAWATPSLASNLPPATPVWDAIAGKILVRDSDSGLVRSDVPPVSHRRWSRSTTVPTAVAYDMGDISASLNSSAGPADVGLHANKSDVVVASTGLYRVDAELYMDASHSSASVSIKINNVPTQTSGFDNQGRANFGRVAYLTAGQTLNLAIQHTAGGDRTFAFAFAVTRIGL